jgi:hypothetical protein
LSVVRGWVRATGDREVRSTGENGRTGVSLCAPDIVDAVLVEAEAVGLVCPVDEVLDVAADAAERRRKRRRGRGEGDMDEGGAKAST